MKQKNYKKLGAILALLLMMTIGANAQTTLASWDFTKVYEEASTVGTQTYYSATSTDVSSNGSDISFTTNTPFFYPSNCVGTSTNYTISGGGSSWKIGAPYNQLYSFQLANSPVNSLDNTTKPSTYNNYYEISFPTTGYKDIQFSMNFSYTDNEQAPVAYVVSIDGGTTWVKVGEIQSSGNWWVSSDYNNLGIAVANQNNVKLRLIGKGTQSSKYWGIKTFSITGTAITTETFSTITASVDNEKSGSASISPAGGSYENGTNLTISATANLGYEFVEWQDGLGATVSTDNPYNTTAAKDASLVAIFKNAPLPAGTEIAAANWSFNSGYEIVDGIYVPNDEVWTQNDWVWTNSSLRANEVYGNSSDYLATIKRDRAWQFNERGGEKTWCLYSQGGTANNITDYTDASQHNQYYQFTFPTRGLSDIKLSFAYTYYSAREGKLELVYSIDGGTTWVDKAAYDTGADANHFASHSDISIPADNKNSVIVRLIQSNGVADYCYLDYFTVTGTIAPRTVTVTAAGYASYYNDCAVEIPSGLTAYWGKLSNDGTKLQLTEISDGIIPAETAVVVKGAANTYSLTATSEAGSTYAENALRGVVADTNVESLNLGTGTIYVLGIAQSTGKAAFCPFTGATLGDHRAYLFVATGGDARTISLDFGKTTGISTLDNLTNSQLDNDAPMYNLAGQKVNKSYKGLVIVNGKKFVR